MGTCQQIKEDFGFIWILWGVQHIKEIRNWYLNKDFIKRRKAGQLSRINMSHTHAEAEGCKHTVKDPSNQNFRLSVPVNAQITLKMNQMDKGVDHWCLWWETGVAESLHLVQNDVMISALFLIVFSVNFNKIQENKCFQQSYAEDLSACLLRQQNYLKHSFFLGMGGERAASLHIFVSKESWTEKDCIAFLSDLDMNLVPNCA